MIIDGRMFREIEDNCYNADARIVECDRDGVDVQVRTQKMESYREDKMIEWNREIERRSRDLEREKDR
jgi:hypothetical protein